QRFATMTLLNRRAFLGSAFAGAAASMSANWVSGIPPIGADREIGNPATNAHQLTTLHLTWQRDPTTTMIVQWIDTSGLATDKTIYYAPTLDLNWFRNWKSSPVIEKPFPKTNFKLVRTELTGLRPGTDYDFRIGHSAPAYRFRTMPAKADDTISFISGGDAGVNEHAVNNNIQAARQDPMFAPI